ncbi:hypothetical protein Pmani_026615 [Petrolisthes manimaculis]|uniref:Uncharacterized protein n=1 Tax=Petrolisthes manimaculis TaxID=1843537 RepID=A0AAE1P3S2_9EUCA|nr:hypothetical protein Pmani_026615 [Petrolisthes manimaculis]
MDKLTPESVTGNSYVSSPDMHRVKTASKKQKETSLFSRRFITAISDEVGAGHQDPGRVTTTPPTSEQHILDTIHSTRLSLVMVDQLTEDLMNILGPVICVQLLMELMMIILYLSLMSQDIRQGNVTFLYYFLMSCLRTFMLINAPEAICSKRRELGKKLRWWSVNVSSVPIREQMAVLEEEVRGGGPTFSVVGAFTLGRHCFVSMLGTVVSYLVITLQFQISGRSDNPDNNNNSTITQP